MSVCLYDVKQIKINTNKVDDGRNITLYYSYCVYEYEDEFAKVDKTSETEKDAIASADATEQVVTFISRLVKHECLFIWCKTNKN